MTQEEKAKRYDEAIKRARTYYKSTHFRNTLEALETIFPELKESEDEIIRKELVAFLKETVEYGGISPDIWTMDNAKKWIAWFEKQVEPKFKIGDIIRHKEYNDKFKILNIEGDSYTLENNIIVSIASQDSWELVNKLVEEVMTECSRMSQEINRLKEKISLTA